MCTHYFPHRCTHSSDTPGIPFWSAQYMFKKSTNVQQYIDNSVKKNISSSKYTQKHPIGNLIRNQVFFLSDRLVVQ